MKSKLDVFVDVQFKPDRVLETRLTKEMRPMRLRYGDGMPLRSKRAWVITFFASVLRPEASKLRRLASRVRQWEGVKGVELTILERLPRRRA